MTRRAFTIVETVLCVLVLALAVPPVLELTSAAAQDRADSVNITRATFLAAMVLETIIADSDSNEPGLGFDAFTTPSAYLDAPGTGLRPRLETLDEPYTAVGMTYSVEVGPLVDASGVVSGNGSENIFRRIIVRVGFPSAAAEPFEMPVTVMVGDLGSP